MPELIASTASGDYPILIKKGALNSVGETRCGGRRRPQGFRRHRRNRLSALSATRSPSPCLPPDSLFPVLPLPAGEGSKVRDYPARTL